MMKATLLVASVLAVSGCASSLTGYESESKFTCALSQGVPCTPVSSVYEQAVNGTLPSQQARAGRQVGGGANSLPVLPLQETMRPFAVAPSSGTPIRSEPRILRIWIAPWEDESGSLRDQQYVFATLDNGRWLIEHNQRSIVDKYRPTTLRQSQTLSNSQTAPTAPNNPTQP